MKRDCINCVWHTFQNGICYCNRELTGMKPTRIDKVFYCWDNRSNKLA